MPDDWTENVIAIVDTVPIPKGFVASQATGENTKAGGLVIYEGTEPVTDANVETAKRTRNQYVWVPIAKEDFETKFVRSLFGTQTYYSIVNTLEEMSNHKLYEIILDSNNMPDVDANREYIDEGHISEASIMEAKEMYESVRKYEGFYIARYEAGIEGTRQYGDDLVTASNVYSMMNKKPYNYVAWSKNEDAGGCVEIARNVYPKDNENYGVVSTLTYGVQWDSMLQWWLDTGVLTKSQITEDSSDFGNFYESNKITSALQLNDGAQVSVLGSTYEISNIEYNAKDSITYPKQATEVWLLTTGALENAKITNTYDIAGNVAEWTMERGHTPEGGFIIPYFRGYDCWVSAMTLVNRETNAGGAPTDYHSFVGFRVSLYIK